MRAAQDDRHSVLCRPFVSSCIGKNLKLLLCALQVGQDVTFLESRRENKREWVTRFFSATNYFGESHAWGCTSNMNMNIGQCSHVA
jgi:hypothetical protein